MPENKTGVIVPEILLPGKEADMTKWAVVACDQYTSQPSYWNAVEDYVGDAPSTLHIIYPEVYLDAEDKEQRIEKICRTMQRYLDEKILEPLPPSFIYVERTIGTGVRRGLIAALDLEEYDYHQGAQSLIRATEETVLDRLPPRIAIRKDAVLEAPHIMVLIDDPEKTVIEPITEAISDSDKLYDFDLMMDGGHITGYRVADSAEIERILNALSKLADPEVFQDKYGIGSDKGVLLFAMGDGNHSFATAKACWDSLKKDLSDDEKKNHPARYALVELVNVHDDSLMFEPIHRVLFQADPKHVFSRMKEFYASEGQRFEYESFTSENEMKAKYNALLSDKSPNNNVHLIPYMYAGEWGILKISPPKSNLEVGTLQAFLDELLNESKNVCVDYIHGDDVTVELGTRKGNMGFLLPAMSKNDLFRTVILDGVLPRKTFSMGEAHEKRYYLECRRISK